MTTNNTQENTTVINNDVEKNEFPSDMYFWTERKVGASIQYRSIIRFLNQNGFYRIPNSGVDAGYQIVRIQDQIMELMDTIKVRDFIIEYFENLLSEGTVECSLQSAENLLDELCQNGHFICDPEKLSMIQKLEGADYVSRVPDGSSSFFKNTAVLVTKDLIETVPYPDVEGIIRKDKILDHEFQYSEEQGDFETFIQKTCLFKDKDSWDLVLDDTSFLSIQSCLGYLLHEYKDPVNPKVCLLIDSVDAENAHADGKGRLRTDGGTGKTLILNAIKHFRNVVNIDGKQFNSKSQFAFSRVTQESDVVLMDDIDKRFEFEKIFSMVTGDWEVERKFKDRVTIDRSDAPKICISSNHALGTRGRSFERRIHVHQIGDYWTLRLAEGVMPSDELSKGRMFEGWDSDEWNRFYSFMLRCIRIYLRSGLVQARTNEYLFAKSMSFIGSRDVTVWIKENVLDTWREDAVQNKNRGRFVYEIHEEFLAWMKQRGDSFTGWTRRKFSDAIRTLAEDSGFDLNKGFTRNRNQVRISGGDRQDCLRVTPIGFDESDLHDFLQENPADDDSESKYLDSEYPGIPTRTAA